MYTGEEFRKIVKPFSSHSHNGVPVKTSDLIVIDFPEPVKDSKITPDNPIIHHVRCGICGKDLAHEEGKSKVDLGGNPAEETKLEITQKMFEEQSPMPA